ncbi:response regulator [Pseudanabaena sp. FACHB-2040]|uniref:hybrid sensor histidine kinase/response regulator n=1 Tax=Pseudanabaena sp. FACHB-2040 TaxID=2692859 RepID=UPI0016891825|nr:response regulator [Pseudanabaena sp. FACHB-2040]MBD2260317.1 response regulator [Pseudanabaena sp. FACHB-2040]
MLSESKVNILLVDDQPENLLALEAILEDLGQNLVRAMSGEAALRHLLHQDFAVILLDVQMPNMDGFEVASLIRSRERSRETPIIFLTAFSTTEQFMFRGYALGAVDYLIKPIATNVLKSKVAVFIELFRKTEALRQQTAALQQQTAQLETINTELQMSEERFRSLSTCSPVGVFVTETSGRCVYTNPRFQALCGLAEEACQNWLQAVHADDQPEAAATWSDYLQGGQEYSLEFRLSTPAAAPLWGHIRAARMLSDQGKFLGHVGTIEDITERKQAEAANARIIREQAAREEAEAANRMKDEFIAILSHELRTPLNAILGWTHLIRSRPCNESTLANALEIIERNAHSQAKLIEDILDVSQIVRGKLQLERHPVDLAAVANAALDTVRSLAEAKGITLVLQFDPNCGLEVVGDAMRLQQVIWNLLTNAVKFTPEQGRIEVHVSAVEAAADSEADQTPQQWAQVQVIDTGIGIEPEFLPYVFERFRQADSTTTRSHGGLGLGLAIVRHLVEQHQGAIQADSPGRNQGSTFTVRLPLQLGQSPAQPSRPSTVTPATTSLEGVQVLVVDDDADTLAFLSCLLRTEGAQVTAAASAIEALEILNSETPAVLLCDISMPDMDGYTLMHKLRTQMSDPQAQIPAIALTAHARLSDQQQALAAGFQRHLAKPIEPRMLVQAITQVMRP